MSTVTVTANVGSRTGPDAPYGTFGPVRCWCWLGGMGHLTLAGIVATKIGVYTSVSTLWVEYLEIRRSREGGREGMGIHSVVVVDLLHSWWMLFIMTNWLLSPTT